MGQLGGTDVSGVEEPRDWPHSMSGSGFPPRLRGIPAIYLIDAVDECDEETVFDFLGSLSMLVWGRQKSVAKVLLFSRHTMLSTINGFFGPVRRIDMNSEDQQIQNVQRYIRTEVKRLCDLRPGLVEFREDIISELDQRSSGIYLLPSLTLKALAKSKGSPANVRKILRGLPQNLQAIYSDALQKVRLEDRARVSAMLLWMMFAMRPLHEEEISAAIEFCSRKREFESLKEFDDEVSRDILGARGIAELVGPLIKTTADGFVTIVHSSAREYILSLEANLEGDTQISLADNSWVWESLITSSSSRGGGDLPALAARALYSYCLELADLVDNETFLLSVSERSPCNFQSRGSQRPQNGVLSLIKYSVENPPDHIRQHLPDRIRKRSPTASNILPSEPWGLFATFLQRKPKGDIWMRTFWALRDPTQQHEHDLSPLHFCCALNVAPCVRKLLPISEFPQWRTRGTQGYLNEEVGQYLTAVDVASMFGNIEILTILCEEHETPVNLDFPLFPGRISHPKTPSTGTFSSTVSLTDTFTAPSDGNDKPVVTSITKSLPRDNVDETRSDGPFLGKESVLSWLVSGGSARNTKPQSYQPLFTATRYGQVSALDYLVGRGCDIFEEEHENGDDDETPRHITKTNRIAFEVAIDGKNRAAASALYQHHTRDSASTRKTLERFITSHAPEDDQNLQRLAYIVGLFPELWTPALKVETGDGSLKTSILHIVATVGSVGDFSFLTHLWRRANPSIHHFPLDSRGRHPLHYAASARQSRTIDLIVRTDPDTRMCVDAQDRNCLYYAASGIKLPWCEKYRGDISLHDVALLLVDSIKSTEACDLLIRSAIISLTEATRSQAPTATYFNKRSIEQNIIT